MEFNINDPKNIIGLTALMQDDNDGVNIESLEKEIINGIEIEKEQDDLVKEFQSGMDRLYKNYNFSSVENDDVFDDDGAQPESDSVFLDDGPTHQVEQSTSEPSSTYSAPTGSYSPPPTNTPSYFPDNEWNGGNGHGSGYGSGHGSGGYGHGGGDRRHRHMSMNERMQNNVRSVIDDLDDNDNVEFGTEYTGDDDDKNCLLEQIDALRNVLDGDGVDLSNVPKLTKDNSFNELQNVYKILQLKNDRNRYCTFAEELILAGAYGLEYLFDGEKDWFGRKPDLIGWPQTVKMRLRRMRFETSTFVKEIMQEYHMSSGMRLMFELIPSMFLYSRQRRVSNSSSDNLVNDNDYKNAISNLNSLGL